MEINDVIKEVAKLLGLSNVLSANLDGNSFDAQTQKDINLIVSSTNEVLSDIAIDYMPLKAKEHIVVENGVFDLTTLTKPFHKLIKVETSQQFRLFRENLFIRDGVYDVVYTYLPEVYELGDSIDDFDSRLTLYALCYGVAAEFCLISGNYSESELWASRYDESMRAVMRSAGIPTLKNRRWI